MSPLSERAKQNQRAYNIQYKKEHIKRIPLDVTQEKYAEIKSAADRGGESVNGWIKKAIEARLTSCE